MKIENSIKYNILIVEDEFVNAQFLIKAITKLGHNITARVKTGEDAIKIIKEQTVHIVFMDINLEGAIDGIECAKQINEYKETPIIYTTAFGDSQTIDEATDTNLYGYLIKPFDYPDIEAVLNLTIKKNYLNKVSLGNKKLAHCGYLGENYKYDSDSQTLLRNDIPIELSKKESTIFYYLFMKINHNVTNEHLSYFVWNDTNIPPSTIRNTMLRLRKKVPDLEILTRSGIGYILKSV
ncbi:MAG: response regulator [Sulfurovum sp.]